MNTQMTDKDLDLLFAESAKRQSDVAQINATVMRTVRRDLRLKKLHKWAKLLGICVTSWGFSSSFTRRKAAP